MESATSIIPNAVSQVQSAVSSVIPDAISQVQSAASSVSTAIPNNITIGTKEFCVGFTRNVTCYDLPFNLSSILSADLRKLLQLNFTDIQSLNRTLTKVTGTTIYDCLALGFALALITVGVSACSMMYSAFGLTGVLGFRVLRAGNIVVGLLSCIPFSVAAFMLLALSIATKHLPSWIRVEQGEVVELCLGSLICFITLAAIGGTWQLLVASRFRA